MKLRSLRVENILGIREITIDFRTPITMILGKNGSAKSSTAESVRLALTGQSPRVQHLKDYHQLVHRGAQAANIELRVDDQTIAVSITAAGKVIDSAKGRETPAALEHILNPRRFANALEPKDRRAFLFGLLGLDLSADAIKARLLARACDATKVETMAPMFRAGFEHAAKHAASEATQAKGGFRAITQETWGSTKGATWRAPVPTFTGEQAAELHALDGSIASAEAELGEANKRLGEAELAQRQEASRRQELAHLRSIASKLDEHTKLHEKTSSELKAYEDALTQAREKAGVVPPPKPRLLPCPECGAALCMERNGSLAPYPTLPADPARDADAAAAIPGLEKSIETMRVVVARHARARDDAQVQAENVKRLEAREPSSVSDPQPIRDTVATLQTSIATMRKRQAELKEAQRKLDEADEKTKAARQHHADVLAWDAIAKALSPDGIPAEILSEALGPVNKRLAQSAADTGWPCVTIATDMAIRVGETPYDLCAESEQYRADVMIAEAISYLSGLKFLVADRADVLDELGMRQMIRWAEILGTEGEVETFILLATTPEDYQPGTPDGVIPANVQVVRLDRGRVVWSREREAA